MDKDQKKICKKYTKAILKKIADGEGLDYKHLVNTYLKKKKKEHIEVVLEKLTVNENNYYYQKKYNSDVYDKDMKIVGKYKDGNISFN